MAKQFNIDYPCPWCKKSHLYADDRAKVKVSAVCHICGRKYIADLYDMQAYRKEADVRRGKSRPFTIRLPCPGEGCNGEVRADGQANVRIAVACTKKKTCQVRYFIADLSNLKTYPSHPIKKIS